MTCYVVARVEIHDRAAYGRYAAAFLPVLKPFGGKLLVSEKSPTALEGEDDGRKLIVLAFPDQAQAQAWAASPAYQEIARDRVAGASVVAVMANGV